MSRQLSHSDTDVDQWFAACPKGLESLLADELSALGAQATRQTVAGVYCNGPLALAYRACLWSRLANRILRPVAVVPAGTADALYEGLMSIEWGSHFAARQSFAIDFSGENRQIRNTQFGAQRSKDAVVDWFVEREKYRPAVDRRQPDVRINIRLVRTQAHIALDYSGGSLHQRGYRQRAGAAPLKENLAAALLLRAGWPDTAGRGGALVDPMCGSATLLLEGAMMAADIAPGLQRSRFGFENLRNFNGAQWQAILGDARARAERGRAAEPPEIRGYDADPGVLRHARDNIARLGLQQVVRVSCKPVATLRKPTHKTLPVGLLICNPPYGERLGEKENLRHLYRQLGQVMSSEFSGWRGAVFTSDLDLGRAVGLRSHKRYAFFNGPIAAHLLLFDLTDNVFRDHVDSASGMSAAEQAASACSDASAPPAAEPLNNTGRGVASTAAESSQQTPTPGGESLSAGGQMFANRIGKNRKHLSSWVKRSQIDCYRLYDADMPEYAVAVDIYGDRVHVAEYQAPVSVSATAAARRMNDVRAALPLALGVPAEHIVYKRRQRQRGDAQYRRRAATGDIFAVAEGQAKLLVNLEDYLDTGLFLDHRPLRLRIAGQARGKRFLNLFCYTGSATVHAALGGASGTTSVDLSNTYLAWLRKNLAHNGLNETSNTVVRANCLEWLEREAGTDGYDLILLDPPSFSNSSAMTDSFDVQRDHCKLVRLAMRLLRPDGQLYFSNNRRGFNIDPALGETFRCENITASTIDPDFRRRSNVHSCWLICHD